MIEHIFCLRNQLKRGEIHITWSSRNFHQRNMKVKYVNQPEFRAKQMQKLFRKTANRSLTVISPHKATLMKFNERVSFTKCEVVNMQSVALNKHFLAIKLCLNSSDL